MSRASDVKSDSVECPPASSTATSVSPVTCAVRVSALNEPTSDCTSF
jgi:hypothetical protein